MMHWDMQWISVYLSSTTTMASHVVQHYGNAPWKVCENNITWHNKQASSKTVYNILKQLQGLINLLCYSICRLISKHPRSSISSPALANHPKVHNITKIIYYYIRYSHNSRLFCPKSEIGLPPFILRHSVYINLLHLPILVIVLTV